MIHKLYRSSVDDGPSSSRARPPSADIAREAAGRIGQILGSKYRLDALIGIGGMACVYRANNESIDRIVAIKTLHSTHAANAAVVTRFLREARTANRVRHPNVVDVIDIGQDVDGLPFIVQEYLVGETLFERAQSQGGRLSLSEVGEYMGPILSAVAAAHEQGVVHRDIKPENVFLADTRGRRMPKLLDFGISKVRTSEQDATAIGVLLGTPAYMAPELARSARDADPRTDVWAIGVMLFELLTGRLPFDGESVVEIFLAVAGHEAKRATQVQPDVPAAVSDVIARCLRKDPSERYATASELAGELMSALERAKPGSTQKWSIAPPPVVIERAPLSEPEARAVVSDDTLPAGAPRVPTLVMESPVLAAAAAPIGKRAATAAVAVPKSPLVDTAKTKRARVPPAAAAAPIGKRAATADVAVPKSPLVDTAKRKKARVPREAPSKSILRDPIVLVALALAVVIAVALFVFLGR